MKDKDLDILLAEYRNQDPTDLQVQKWKRAVHQEMSTKVAAPKYLWMQLAAASLVGFLIGAILFKTSDADTFQSIANNNSENATIEYVYTKIN